MSFLKVENISKTFGFYKAVDNISFEVPKGIVFGLLGPNGAGKTTTIRMINNIILPDSGKITLNEREIDYEVQNYIGYLPEERGLYKKLKVIDQLIYFASLKAVPSKIAEERAYFWLEKLGAKGWENKKIQELSKGMQQKVQFISTVLHNPDLLILDEPFSGFDPINTEILKNIILEMKNDGKTVILSTHIMSQVEELCDEILLINKGQVILDGKVKEIKKRYGNNSFYIEFDKEIENLPQNSNLIKIHKKNYNNIEFELANSDVKINDVLEFFIKNYTITKFQQTEPTLHEIFINEVGKINLKNKELINEK